MERRVMAAEVKSDERKVTSEKDAEALRTAPVDLLAQFEHAQDWRFGAFAKRFRQSDLGFEIQQCIVRFLKRVHLHKSALTAEAIFCRSGNECFARNLLAQPMQQAGFGHDDDFVGRRFLAKRHHFFGGTDFIREHAHRVSAFRVRNHRRIRIFFTNLSDAPRSKLNVNVTGALPQIHLASGPLHYPRAQILIRNKENVAVRWRGAHDLVGITARTDDIRLRLHSRATVDVRDDIIILVGVLLKEFGELFGRT